MSSLYTFNGQTINLLEVNKINEIVERKELGKPYYSFIVILGGEQITSELYVSLTNATTARNNLITEVNSALSEIGVSTLTMRTETASFTLSDTDNNKYIRYTGSGNITVSIPNVIELSSVITIFQAGVGIITLEPEETGISLYGGLSSAGQYSVMQIIKIDDEGFDIIGGVTY